MKNNTINTQPASGFRDFQAKEQIFKQWCVNTINAIYSKYGYDPISTPAVEKIEVLNGKSGEESDMLMFKISQRGEKSGEAEDMGLRYDFTVPLARFYAEYKGQLPKIFKRQQIGPCWRAERPGKGRFREFYQADIDTIGSSSILVETDTILVLAEALKAIGLDGLVAKINSRELLQAIMDIYNIEKEKQNSFLVALDKFDKIGVEGVKEELVKRGFDIKIGEEIMNVLLDEELLKEKLESSELGKKSLGEVKQVVDWINTNSKDAEAVFSPFVIRGQDYYTGIIFEIYSIGVTGAAAGGGRFDNLVGMFSGEDNIPACGGSIGLDRNVSILLEQGKGIIKDNKPKILVTVWDKDMITNSLNIASKLRELGLQTELYLGDDKIGDQLKYAVASGCKYCIICGPDEKEKEEVTVKNLDTREQNNISLNELTNFNFQ